MCVNLCERVRMCEDLCECVCMCVIVWDVRPVSRNVTKKPVVSTVDTQPVSAPATSKYNCIVLIVPSRLIAPSRPIAPSRSSVRVRARTGQSSVSVSAQHFAVHTAKHPQQRHILAIVVESHDFQLCSWQARRHSASVDRCLHRRAFTICPSNADVSLRLCFPFYPMSCHFTPEQAVPPHLVPCHAMTSPYSP